MASPGLGFGAGLARGLEKAYSRHIDRKEDRRKEERQEQLREFSLLYPGAAANAEATGDYAALEDFIGATFPTTAKHTAERRAAKAAKAPKVTPPTLMPSIAGVAEPAAAPPAVADVTQAGPAAGPTLEQPAATASPLPASTAPSQSTPQVLSARPAVSPGTPAPQPGPEQDFFGMTMQTPAQRRQAALDEDLEKLQATRRAWVGLARKLLPELQAVDPSINLEDALRYVSKGELMSAASQRGGASAYRYGVDREAIAKSLFSKNYDALTQQEAQIVLREEKQMLEAEANARGTGTATAKFNAPADLGTARENQVPVGTRASDVAGQQVPTAAMADRRRSIETLRNQLMEIRDGYVDEKTGATIPLLDVLPKKGDMVGGKLPGLVWAARRRGADPSMPDAREKAAALESRVNGIVNSMARVVGEQRGGQTEADALRAEASILGVRDNILAGDTLESANARIEQTLRLVDSILGALPSAPVATRPPATGAPAAGAPAAGAPAATPATLKKNEKGEWVFSTP